MSDYLAPVYVCKLHLFAWCLGVLCGVSAEGLVVMHVFMHSVDVLESKSMVSHGLAEEWEEAMVRRSYDVSTVWTTIRGGFCLSHCCKMYIGGGCRLAAVC